MVDRPAAISPQAWARTGGALYLLIFGTAALSMGLQSHLTVSGNAAATAQNILAAPSQWRLSIAAELVMFACDIPLAVIFYVLLRPVNPNLALLAAFFRFAEAVIGSLNVTWHVAPLLVAPQQLQTFVLLSLKLYNYGFAIALVPFGFHCILLGYLIFRSTYLPKTLGVLMTIAGFAYVVNSFALVAAPGLAGATFIAMLLSGFPAELGLCLWLLIFGINVRRFSAS